MHLQSGGSRPLSRRRHGLSHLSEEESVYYNTVFNERIDNLISNDETECEYREIKKTIERTKAAIAAQVKNMREASEALKKYIQDDITEMTAEVEKLEADLFRIEETKANNQIMSHDLNEIRKKLLSFGELAKAATPEEVINLIGAVVERIYIVTENDKQICHIFVKGCKTED